MEIAGKGWQREAMAQVIQPTKEAMGIQKMRALLLLHPMPNRMQTKPRNIGQASKQAPRQVFCGCGALRAPQPQKTWRGACDEHAEGKENDFASAQANSPGFLKSPLVRPFPRCGEEQSMYENKMTFPP